MSCLTMANFVFFSSLNSIDNIGRCRKYCVFANLGPNVIPETTATLVASFLRFAPLGPTSNNPKQDL